MGCSRAQFTEFWPTQRRRGFLWLSSTHLNQIKRLDQKKVWSMRKENKYTRKWNSILLCTGNTTSKERGQFMWQKFRSVPSAWCLVVFLTSSLYTLPDNVVCIIDNLCTLSIWRSFVKPFPRYFPSFGSMLIWLKVMGVSKLEGPA